MLTWAVPVPEKRVVELWTIEVTSGRHRVTWQGSANYVQMPLAPKWSPDGRRIGFTMWTEHPTEIWALQNYPSLPESAEN